MKKESIKAAIVAKVGSTKYSIWRIGLTHDPAKRKQEWKDEGASVTSWAHWQADSLSDAQEIEAHFIKKGMKGGSGGDLSAYKAVYVYVF
jgi:hypothetical protein